MKSIALTGATSMIGLALIDQCIKKSIFVTAFVRAGSKRIERLPKSGLITIFQSDLDQLSSFSVQKSMKPVDTFYHFGWSHTDKLGRLNSKKQLKNIEYTIDAVHLAKKIGCRRFIGAGSQAEYGLANCVLTAQTPVNPITAYGITKYSAGKISRIECEKAGLQHIWVRILSIYGKNDNAGTLVAELVKNCYENKPMQLSSCTQDWDYLHEIDAGRAFLALGESIFSNKTYCLGSGKSQPLKNYVETIVSAMNSEYKPQYRKLSNETNALLSLSCDISDLTMDTGWKPEIDFADGIKILSKLDCL